MPKEEDKITTAVVPEYSEGQKTDKNFWNPLWLPDNPTDGSQEAAYIKGIKDGIQRNRDVALKELRQLPFDRRAERLKEISADSKYDPSRWREHLENQYREGKAAWEHEAKQSDLYKAQELYRSQTMPGAGTLDTGPMLGAFQPINPAEVNWAWSPRNVELPAEYGDVPETYINKKMDEWMSSPYPEDYLSYAENAARFAGSVGEHHKIFNEKRMAERQSFVDALFPTLPYLGNPIAAISRKVTGGSPQEHKNSARNLNGVYGGWSLADRENAELSKNMFLNNLAGNLAQAGFMQASGLPNAINSLKVTPLIGQTLSPMQKVINGIIGAGSAATKLSPAISSLNAAGDALTDNGNPNIGAAANLASGLIKSVPTNKLLGSVIGAAGQNYPQLIKWLSNPLIGVPVTLEAFPYFTNIIYPEEKSPYPITDFASALYAAAKNKVGKTVSPLTTMFTASDFDKAVGKIDPQNRQRYLDSGEGEAFASSGYNNDQIVERLCANEMYNSAMYNADSYLVRRYGKPGEPPQETVAAIPEEEKSATIKDNLRSVIATGAPLTAAQLNHQWLSNKDHEDLVKLYAIAQTSRKYSSFGGRVNNLLSNIDEYMKGDAGTRVIKQLMQGDTADPEFIRMVTDLGVRKVEDALAGKQTEPTNDTSALPELAYGMLPYASKQKLLDKVRAADGYGIANLLASNGSGGGSGAIKVDVGRVALKRLASDASVLRQFLKRYNETAAAGNGGLGQERLGEVKALLNGINLDDVLGSIGDKKFLEVAKYLSSAEGREYLKTHGGEAGDNPIANTFIDAFKKRIYQALKNDPFGNAPLVTALYLRMHGFDSMAEFAEDPLKFYTTLAVILGGTIFMGKTLFGGNENDADVSQDMDDAQLVNRMNRQRELATTAW